MSHILRTIATNDMQQPTKIYFQVNLLRLKTCESSHNNATLYVRRRGHIINVDSIANVVVFPITSILQLQLFPKK